MNENRYVHILIDELKLKKKNIKNTKNAKLYEFLYDISYN